MRRLFFVLTRAAIGFASAATLFAQNPSAPPAPQARGGGRGRGQVVVMALTSPAFVDGARIPDRNAQAGHDVSPSLSWIGAPDSTASFVHSLPEGVPQGGQLADGSRQISGTGPYYRGPAAPASGPVHHYAFELYALDVMLDIPAVGASPPATRAAVMAAMAMHIRGKAVIVGFYKRAP